MLEYFVNFVIKILPIIILEIKMTIAF